MTPEQIEEMKRDGKRRHFTEVRQVSVRWEPYKPDLARQMKKPGRWQESVRYGGFWRWQNCDEPSDLHHEDFDYRDRLLALTAEIDRLRAKVEALTEALETAAAQAQGTPHHPYCAMVIETARAALSPTDAQEDWHELHQERQPLLADGYTAIKAVRPGVWMVRGPHPGGTPWHAP